MAPRRSQRRGYSSSGKRLADLAEDTKRKINNIARRAAVEIMNDLAEAGPNYSGAFRDSWIAIPVGKGATGSVGGGYPYSMSQVPQLSTTISRELGRKIKFTIENTAPYAPQALDLEGDVFFAQEFEPQGRVVDKGLRSNPGIRGSILSGGRRKDGSPGKAVITAKLDWYIDYLNGGGLQKSLEGGVKLGFRID
jgi:hypothetical protein